MNVACTKCGKAYRLPEGMAVPGMQIRMRCKACGIEFDVAIPSSPGGAAPIAAPPAPAAAAVDDPLASVRNLGEMGAAPSDVNAPIGEITRHFIKQSGADRRNPWWKKLLFAASLVALPAAVLFLLSNTFKVVTVTRTTESGDQVQESFFSANGVSGLRDMLTGEEAKRRAEAEQKKAARKARAPVSPTAGATVGGTNGLDDMGRRGGTAGSVASADPSLPSGGMAAFYQADDGRRDVAPKLKGADAPAAQHAGGLDDTAAAKVVAASQPAFQGCIEEGLRRNPNLKVGKIVMKVTVAASGTVKGASLSPKQHETSEWGGCLQQRAKRMVFPPFEGDDEAEIEVPLVVGVSL